MKTPPKMLSPKDSAYLSDLLTTTLITAKKVRNDINHLEDEDLKEHFSSAYEVLCNQYDTLLNIL